MSDDRAIIPGCQGIEFAVDMETLEPGVPWFWPFEPDFGKYGFEWKRSGIWGAVGLTKWGQKPGERGRNRMSGP